MSQATTILTPVEEIIIDEMKNVHLETRSEIRHFIFEAARFLGASCARALELSYSLIEYS
jgi:hypothetical protein